MGTKILQALGRNAPYVNVLPAPIIAQSSKIAHHLNIYHLFSWVSQIHQKEYEYLQLSRGLCLTAVTQGTSR